ncbi:MAG: UvrD-helicase domain-containing protein [Clostridiales bacterium]|nr:UvrD-helicase domain-containing protein [Clostridiales bacterium]
MNSIYETLNPAQQEAVFTTEGPVLVLAGAGSGKTRALTHRIAYLIQEKGVCPWNILAITFTNKAAGEMRERVDSLIGEGGASVWVATFHSTCVRILRRYADYLGYTNRFSIYDGDDQKTLMRQVLKKLDLDPKQFREKAVLSVISAAKNELIDARDFERENQGDFRLRKVAKAYLEYERLCLENNAMDFDDLLVNTVKLFRQHPEVLEEYQERFSYIMVDEYQDTNTAQFQLVALLAEKRKNLCVVGDDDQSIYKFRGANIQNILDFEKTFPGAKVIKLEQNYRSTKQILEVANQVIRHNLGRRDKTLWTDNPDGDLVSYRQYETAYDEADAIVRDILQNRDTYPFGSCAVLYRTNAQSRLLEEKCVVYNIPYRLVGGVNFYQRKEIKDLICYLKTIDNGRDELAVQRIINVPRRGIGAASIAKVAAHADSMGMSFYDALADYEHVAGLGRTAGKISAFVDQIQVFRSQALFLTVKELLERVLEDTGYQEELEAEDTVESRARLENIQELLNKAADFGDSPEDKEALGRFLEEIALVSDLDSVDDEEERVVLMTLHSAKGLEFPKVYLAGMEDGLFPSSMSINSEDPTDLEEERRLCYVGITRAREKLLLTSAKMRMVNGETRYSRNSRFVDEIPRSLLQIREKTSAVFSREDTGRANVSDRNSTVGTYRPKTQILNTSGTQSYGMGKAFQVKKAENLSYQKGDRVRHIKFGEGIVTDLEEGRRDYEVTVQFDHFGEKHLFASFAKLEKI